MRGVSENAMYACRQHGAAFVKLELEIGDATLDWDNSRVPESMSCPLGDHQMPKVSSDDFEDIG